MDIPKKRSPSPDLTADNLRTVLKANLANELAPLDLNEVDAMVERVAHLVPAGTVSSMISSGWARLSGRRPNARQDINLLMRGTGQTKDHVVYGAFFAGPAAVMWAYQSLWRLAGKDPDDAFPDGMWQFYADYALREDTARHANETVGFDARLRQYKIDLTPVNRLTAWVMAAIITLHQYPEMIRNEWRERVYTTTLRDLTRDLPEAKRFAKLYAQWERQRPYGRGADAGARESYTAYRRRKFDAFLEQAMRGLSDDLSRQWVERVNAAKAEIPAYQQQMSIQAYLEAEDYGEIHRPLPLAQTMVGMIYQGQYYLIPTCLPGTERPPDVNTVRAQVAAILATELPPSEEPLMLTPVARLARAAYATLRPKLNPALQDDLNALRAAPILINFDARARALPLPELRQAERGVGDHPLTIFDTGESFVFDQSHIFFDGAWGAVLAEVLTQEALAWAVYLNSLPEAASTPVVPKRLTARLSPEEMERLKALPTATDEVGIETDAVNVKAIQSLRALFKRRSDLLELTVNDLLVLYRSIHALTYEPSKELKERLEHLPSAIATAAREGLAAQHANPVILIPVDASQHRPRDRVYPMTVEVPIEELDLYNLHNKVADALRAYKDAPGDRTEVYAEFDALQRKYLSALAGFGKVLAQLKDNAMQGGSNSVKTMKLLAHVPVQVQRWMDKIPHKFEVLNDLIKGREVFSNIGAVPSHATVTRFSTAKDDNERKDLAWGIVTDAQGVMRITLRDFRPHVRQLAQAGYPEIAYRLTRDYLDAYATGLNKFVRDLHHITQASRETQMVKPNDG